MYKCIWCLENLSLEYNKDYKFYQTEKDLLFFHSVCFGYYIKPIIICKWN